MDAPKDKAAWRATQLQKLRDEVTAETRTQWSQAILAHLQAWEVFQRAQVVLLYAPLLPEPDLLPLLGLGKRWCFPRVDGSQLSLHEVQTASQLQRTRGWLNEPDPRSCPVVAAAEIELALIPGLAFDPLTRIRLGRGGGFYDRLLAQPDFTAQTVGVCFPFQICSELPKVNHDVPMHVVVSAEGLI